MVLFHPRTAAIRSLGSFPIVLIDYFVKFLNVPSVWPFALQGYSLRSPSFDPLTPLDALIPYHPSSDSAYDSASDSESESDSDSESVDMASVVLYFAASRYIPSCSHHRQDTHAPNLCVDLS